MPTLQAILLASAGCVAFASQAQLWLSLDGPKLLANQAQEASWYHIVHLPVARIVQRVTGADAMEGLLFTSALFAALALGGVYLALRAAGFRVVDVLGPLLVLATLPALWFHATIVEVHTAQLAGGVTLLGCAVWLGRATRRGVLVGSFLWSLAAVSLHLANTFLLPVLPLLAPRGVRLRAACGLVLGVVAVHLFSDLVRRPGASSGFSHSVWLVRDFWLGPGFEFTRRELLVPLAGPLALGVLGLAVRRRTPTPDRPALDPVLIALPALVFFTLYGIETQSGYYLASMPFLVFPVARSRTFLVACLVVAGVQALFVPRTLDQPQRAPLEALLQQRTRLAEEALPEGGVLISLEPFRQEVTGLAPNVYEHNLAPAIRRAWQLGTLEERLADGLWRAVLADLEPEVPVAYDPGFRETARAVPEIDAVLREMELELARRYVFEPASEDELAFLVLVPRS